MKSVGVQSVLDLQNTPQRIHTVLNNLSLSNNKYEYMNLYILIRVYMNIIKIEPTGFNGKQVENVHF